MEAVDYSNLNKKMDEMQIEMRSLSDNFIRMTAINESYQSIIAKSHKDIDAMAEKIRSLEGQSSKFDGGLNAFRYISFFVCSILFAACGWIWGALDNNTKDTITLKEKVANIEMNFQKVSK